MRVITSMYPLSVITPFPKYGNCFGKWAQAKTDSTVLRLYTHRTCSLYGSVLRPMRVESLRGSSFVTITNDDSSSSSSSSSSNLTCVDRVIRVKNGAVLRLMRVGRILIRVYNTNKDSLLLLLLLLLLRVLCVERIPLDFLE